MMKKYLNPYRLTTYLLLLYCFGHTYGALISTPHFGPESDMVVAAMKSVHVNANGSDCTWWGFYLGFGYDVSIFFLFSAFVTWFLGGREQREQRAWVSVSWALFVSYAAGTALALRYFFLPPIVFSFLITALLGWQCIRLSRPSPTASTE